MKKSVKAYNDPAFVNSPDARPLRILAEYLEPQARLAKYGIEDTIVFFGSARVVPEHQHYREAHGLAYRLTQWTEALHEKGRRFVICTGGGPGIMEAANKGAADAGGVTVGMSIALPREASGNAHITKDLDIHFHYFFMRKFWLVYSAKAVVVFPGGFGTLDELFEVLTLVQTRRMTKTLPIVLFGSAYWKEVVNFDALVRHGVIHVDDLKLFRLCDTVEDAFDCITTCLAGEAIARPGAVL